MKIIGPTNPNINPEAEFPKVEKMLYNLAWKYARKHPYPDEEQMFVECKSIVFCAFMRACHTFDPNKGHKFSSRVYFHANNWLMDFITKRSTDPLVCMELDDELTGAAPPLRVESLELIEDLSEDAKEIVHLITETPHDLLGGMPATARQLMRAVKLHLITKRGKTKQQVEAAHVELRTTFLEAWA